MAKTSFTRIIISLKTDKVNRFLFFWKELHFAESKQNKNEWLLFCARGERMQFDAEDVVDQSSPYKGTAEWSSATKKPHKNEENRL